MVEARPRSLIMQWLGCSAKHVRKPKAYMSQDPSDTVCDVFEQCHVTVRHRLSSTTSLASATRADATMKCLTIHELWSNANARQRPSMRYK